MAPDTKTRIAEATLGLLRTTGMDGLTMRQVAQAAGISLGNLQYHFKTKGSLLTFTAAHYFQIHDAGAAARVTPGLEQGQPGAVHAFLTGLLRDAEQVSDACLIFREMWAVATRDASVQAHVDAYYTRLAAALTDLWTPCGVDHARHATTLVLAYLDGYSISHRALPGDRDEIAELLTRVVCGVLDTVEAPRSGT